MLSAKDIILEYAFPGLGALTANVMFASPFWSVKQALQRGELDDLNPTPWAFMLGNTAGWILYGILIRNWFVFWGNAPGFCLSVWFNLVAVKLIYRSHTAKYTRESLVDALQSQYLRQADRNDNKDSVGDDRGNRQDSPWASSDNAEAQKASLMSLIWDVTSQNIPSPAAHENLVLGMVIFWLGIVSTVALGRFAQDTKELLVGVVVNGNLVFFYGAPLSTIAQVLRTKSSTSIHVPTMLTNTFNGLFWAVYGVAVLDYFIAVPNSLGALLGGIQILLCVMFPRKRVVSLDDKDEETGKSGNETRMDVEKSCTELITVAEAPRNTE